MRCHGHMTPQKNGGTSSKNWQMSWLLCGEICLACTVEAIAVVKTKSLAIELQRLSNAVEGHQGVFIGVGAMLTESCGSDRDSTFGSGMAMYTELLRASSFATVQLDRK